MRVSLPDGPVWWDYEAPQLLYGSVTPLSETSKRKKKRKRKKAPLGFQPPKKTHA